MFKYVKLEFQYITATERHKIARIQITQSPNLHKVKITNLTIKYVLTSDTYLVRLQQIQALRVIKRN